MVMIGSHDNPVQRDRESGVELLRLVLMFCIIIHHLIDWGGGLTPIPKSEWANSFGTYQKIFLFSFFRYVTVCFVFVSAFYGIRLKFRRLLELWLECFFYSVAILLICQFFHLTPIPDSTREYLKYFLPISGKRWWFMTTYFELALLSPVINYFLRKIPLPWLKYFLLLGAVINFIHAVNLLLFIFVYALGYYFRNVEIKIRISQFKFLLGYLLSGLLVALIGIVIFFLHFRYGTSLPLDFLWSFGNPVIIFSSICVFYLFRNLKIQSTKINYLGKLSLAVYLIHVHPLIINNIIPGLWGIDKLAGTGYYILYLMLYAAVIWVFCFAVELIRYNIMKPLVRILQKIIIWEPPLSPEAR